MQGKTSHVNKKKPIIQNKRYGLTKDLGKPNLLLLDARLDYFLYLHFWWDQGQIQAHPNLYQMTGHHPFHDHKAGNGFDTYQDPSHCQIHDCVASHLNDQIQNYTDDQDFVAWQENWNLHEFYILKKPVSPKISKLQSNKRKS